jgi:hypothetical protein
MPCTIRDSARSVVVADRPVLAGFCKARFARRRRDCAEAITARWSSLAFRQRRRWPSLIACRPPALSDDMRDTPYPDDGQERWPQQRRG